MKEATIDDLVNVDGDRVLDANGWPIEPTARVYVVARPGLDGHGEVSGFGGIVVGVKPGQVDIIEFTTFNHRAIHPRFVKVQAGSCDTKAAQEFHDAVKALERTRTRPRRI
jgi:hypothetical protein